MSYATALIIIVAAGVIFIAAGIYAVALQTKWMRANKESE